MPLAKCTVAMAVTIVAVSRSPATGVISPSASSAPPANSAKPAIAAIGLAGRSPSEPKNPPVPSSPWPPNTPNSFCAPWPTNSRPTTSLTTRSPSAIDSAPLRRIVAYATNISRAGRSETRGRRPETGDRLAGRGRCRQVRCGRLRRDLRHRVLRQCGDRQARVHTDVGRHRSAVADEQVLVPEDALVRVDDPGRGVLADHRAADYVRGGGDVEHRLGDPR